MFRQISNSLLARLGPSLLFHFRHLIRGDTLRSRLLGSYSRFSVLYFLESKKYQNHILARSYLHQTTLYKYESEKSIDTLLYVSECSRGVFLEFYQAEMSAAGELYCFMNPQTSFLSASSDFCASGPPKL